MSYRLLIGLVVIGALLLLIPLLLFAGNGDSAGDDPPPLEEQAKDPDVAELPTMALAYLATDRPWRAAIYMQEYMDRVDEPSADRKLLAARAEAGWGNWAAVLPLLDGAGGLADLEGGLGLYLQARALDDAGSDAAAINAYRAFLTASAPGGDLERQREAARLRLGLALLRAGSSTEAETELGFAAEVLGGGTAWLDAMRAQALAAAGDQSGVQIISGRYDSGIAGLWARRARVEAARSAGDLARARQLANDAISWARTDATRAEFTVTAARLAIEMGDEAQGRAALRAAIGVSDSGPAAREAAELLRGFAMNPDEHLAVARVLRAQGLHEESLEGYRAWLESGQSSAGNRSRVRLEYANALFYAERYDQVEEALRPISGQTDAQMLLARNEAHLDRFDDATRRYLAISQQTSGNQAILALYLAADTRHAEGNDDAARELFNRVISRHAGTSLMGLAMMRVAGMAYLKGAYAEAARVWGDYRRRYPSGGNAVQATYWEARALEARGRTAEANNLYREVRRRARDSYYALKASERLGEDFWPLPMSASPGSNAEADQRVARWMRGIDLLREAGFDDLASAEADRIVPLASGNRALQYALAEALAERGYSQRAIRIGLDIQRGSSPNARLYRILHPFPYRTLITEEARDRDLDPFVTAALIRQESMFEARITSPAGARGLMQIMPATGRSLAADAGLDLYDADILYHPEINVHLGTKYVARHWDNYDGALPPVFAAYNAGWHRVEWWSRYPEFEHDELFTERIPFRETRDYVKILTRNHAVYQGLYGEQN